MKGLKITLIKGLKKYINQDIKNIIMKGPRKYLNEGSKKGL